MSSCEFSNRFNMLYTYVFFFYPSYGSSSYLCTHDFALQELFLLNEVNTYIACNVFTLILFVFFISSLFVSIFFSVFSVLRI